MPFPLDGKDKALYEMKRGLRLIFQAGGPAFLRFLLQKFTRVQLLLLIL